MKVFCNLCKCFVICASVLWFVQVFYDLCKCFLFVQVFSICASVFYLCKCFVRMSHRNNSFLEAFEDSIKAMDASNDQKSLLEMKRKRTQLSFPVILLKLFLEDLKSEHKWLCNSCQHKNIISLNCTAWVLTLQNSARSNQLWPLFSAL